MKHIYLLSLCLCASAGVYAQTEQDTLVTDEKLVILLGTKVIESAQTVAQKVVVVNSETLKNGNAQTSADVLAQTGEVLVQKSQQGGGSPMLRGFEASRVLLVVDGVRMNNIIYRAGHLQNVITIDNQMLDRVEVLMGPSSTRYGSDALGGAMCFYTKKPTFATNKNGFVFKGNTNARWSSANMEKTGHIDLNFGFKKLAFLSSFTYSDFGDLRAGTVYPDKYPNFGKRTFYVQRFDGKDSMIQNTRPNYQIGTAYKQWGFMQKVAFRPNENTTHQLNIQLSNSSNVPRYDRLTELGGNGKPSQAEWYYGPQKRNLLAYDMDSKGFHLGVNGEKS